jgi:hypothetical protein
MAPHASPKGSLPARFDDYVRHELWRVDPTLAGKGMGLLLHERRGRWAVRRVLKGSPAERAGVEPGSIVQAIDDYEMRRVDVAELQLTIRSRPSGPCAVRIVAGRRPAQLAIGLRSLRSIIGTDVVLGGDEYCNTCRLCQTTTNGFVTCSEDGRCSGRCTVV